MTPTLRTNRLLLEPYGPEDEAAFVALFQDTRVSRWMGDGPKPESDTRDLFGRVFTNVYPQGAFDVWAVRRDGQLIGHAEIKPTETVGGHEIIYALAPAAWGAGLGTELAEALVTYGFDQLGLAEVHATVAAENEVSLALLTKIGFAHARDLTRDDGGTTRVFTRRRTGSGGERRSLVDDRWIIDELAHAGAEHLDSDFVSGYDRKQGHPDHAEDLAVLRSHGVDTTSTVLDLGAGTGRFALAAAAAFGRVIAVDVSPAMLSRLRGEATAAGLANLECVQAGFLSYHHSGPPLDAVYTRHALHQLPDFWKALALDRIARMLRPGGVLRMRDLIYDFAPAEAEEVFEGWFAGAADDPAAGYTAEDYATHIRTEHSTFRWLFEPMLTAAGFEIVTVDYAGRVFGTYTCVKRG